MTAWRWSYTLLYAYNLHFKSPLRRKRFFDYLFSLSGIGGDTRVSGEAWRRAERDTIPFQRSGGCMSCISCSPLTPWAENKAVDPRRVGQMTIYPIRPHTEQG